VMLTLALQVTAHAVFIGVVSITGGTVGITGIPRPRLGDYTLGSAPQIAAFFAVLALAFHICLWALKRSVVGRLFLAAKDDRIGAASIGVPTRGLVVFVLALSAALAGMAGAMFGAYMTFIDPTSFGLDQSLILLSMLVIGGPGRTFGPLFGAALIIAIPEVLRVLSLSSATAGGVRQLIFGLALTVIVLARPQGLSGSRSK